MKKNQKNNLKLNNMETAEILKLTDSKIKSIKVHIDYLLDLEDAELDIVHPSDMIDNKRRRITACKIVRKKLTEIYALIEKIEEVENEDIVNIEISIDESLL